MTHTTSATPTPVIDRVLSLYPELAGFRPWLVEPSDVVPSDNGLEPFNDLYPANRGSAEQLKEGEELLSRGEQEHPLEDAWVPATWVLNILSEGEVTLKEDTYGRPAGGIAQDASGDWVSPLPAGTTIRITAPARGGDSGSARVLYNGKCERKWTFQEQRALLHHGDAKRKLYMLQWWVDAAAEFTPRQWEAAEARRLRK